MEAWEPECVGLNNLTGKSGGRVLSHHPSVLSSFIFYVGIFLSVCFQLMTFTRLLLQKARVSVYALKMCVKGFAVFWAFLCLMVFSNSSVMLQECYVYPDRVGERSLSSS